MPLLYIDPTTGNFLLQLLLGGIATGWLFLKFFGKKILTFFGRGEKERSEE